MCVCVCMCPRVCACVVVCAHVCVDLSYSGAAVCVHCQSSPTLHNHLLLLAPLLSQGYWNSTCPNLFSMTASHSINWPNWLCLRASPLHGPTIPLSHVPCSVLVLYSIYVHTMPYVCAIMFTWFNGHGICRSAAVHKGFICENFPPQWMCTVQW